MRTLPALTLSMLLVMSQGCVVRAQDQPDYPPAPGYAGDAPPPDDGYGDDGGDDERPGYDPDVEAGDYQQPLDPYGEWVVDRTYGRVWRPSVEVGWAPYTDGTWGWSRWGWTFVAPVPWGWTFHYGRWVDSPVFGWAWYPGTVWGPAWVDWYAGDGYVGWAPLAPFGVVSVNHYVFVDERRFCSPGLRGWIRHDRDVPESVRHDVWDRRIVRPPDHDHILHVAHDPVRQFDHGGGVVHRNPGGDDRVGRPGEAGGRGPWRGGDDRPRRVERGGDSNPGRYAQPGRPWNGGEDRGAPRRIERPDDDARPRDGRPGVDGGGQPRGPGYLGPPRQMYRVPPGVAEPRRMPAVTPPPRIERDDRRVIERAPGFRTGGAPPMGYRQAQPMPAPHGSGFAGGTPGGGQGGWHHGHRVGR